MKVWWVVPGLCRWEVLGTLAMALMGLWKTQTLLDLIITLHPELQPVDVCNRSCVIFLREYWNVLQPYCDCTCHHAACLASSDVLVMYSTTRTSPSTLHASFDKASLTKTPPDATPDRSFNELN